MRYRSIIFDLGAVILDIDFHKTIDAFIQLGISDFNSIFSAVVQSEVFDLFDKGLISPEKFRSELMAISGKQINTEDFDKAWNAMIIGYPKQRIEYITVLKKKFPLFLLSNTNSIHFPVYNSMLKENFGINDISELFTKTYLSFELGLRKPQPEIFNLVLSENDLIPEQTLFVDDNKDNIEAASKMGISTFHLSSELKIERDLDRILRN